MLPTHDAPCYKDQASQEGLRVVATGEEDEKVWVRQPAQKKINCFGF